GKYFAIDVLKETAMRNSKPNINIGYMVKFVIKLKYFCSRPSSINFVFSSDFALTLNCQVL
ncbi:hypothetical protein OFC53_39220, partial [Escherichia coli]|nr:hypothetical protein [Escherichia coli]